MLDRPICFGETVRAGPSFWWGLNGLITDCRAAVGAEVRGLARTLAQWREPIGPVEGLNSLIKKVKRIAAGFPSFTNYRLCILLACGGCNWAPSSEPHPAETRSAHKVRPNWTRAR